jgi:hypothetical protein
MHNTIIIGVYVASQAWNIRLGESLTTLGFAKCPSKHALCTKRVTHNTIIISVYVDDLITTGENTTDIDAFKKQMTKMFP